MTKKLGNLNRNTWHARETLRINTQDIEFQNDRASLSGTAYFPAEGKNISGIVALHGASEPSRSSRLYQHLWEGLPRIGIGILVFDRRGTGKSTGRSKGTDYETLARDAIAGQSALAKLSPIDPKNVGFWGISQGGWIALLATRLSMLPAFAVAVSTPLVTPERQMEFATSNLLKVRGYSQKDVREMLHARIAWLAYLKERISLATVSDIIRKVERKSWFRLAFMPKTKELESSRGALKELYYDPLDALYDIKVPLLFIYGSEDPWTPVEESIKQLRKIARKRDNISYTVIPKANHEMMFRERETMEFDEEVLKIAPEAPSYFMEMTMWLSKYVKR